jgi:hypothetical protein
MCIRRPRIKQGRSSSSWGLLQRLAERISKRVGRFYVGLDSIFATEHFGELVPRHIGELVEAGEDRQL